MRIALVLAATLLLEGCPLLKDGTSAASLCEGERPQVLVPGWAWQSAESLGAWTLVGCTVAPAFEFSGFEMAPPDWTPGGD